MASDEKFSKNLDDEQLDEVAGGNKKDMRKDIKFLKAMGFALSKNASDEEIQAAWRDVGVKGIVDDEAPNNYLKFSDDGKPVLTRQDAMIIAMRKARHVVNLDDYL